MEDLAAALATVESECRLNDRIVAAFVVLLKHPGQQVSIIILARSTFHVSDGAGMVLDNLFILMLEQLCPAIEEQVAPTGALGR